MNNERGMITILGLIMILLLILMGTTLLMLSTTNLQIATSHQEGLTAQYLAEAGIQSAITKLKTNGDFVSQTEKEDQVITADFFSTLAITSSYKVQIGPDPKSTNKDLRLVIATGMVNHAQRRIIAHITLAKATNDYKIIWNFREDENFGT